MKGPFFHLFVSGFSCRYCSYLKPFELKFLLVVLKGKFHANQFSSSYVPCFYIYQTELNVRRSPGGLYYLSYLDRDMLLGRSVGGGGVFIFTRAQPLLWRFSDNQEYHLMTWQRYLSLPTYNTFHVITPHSSLLRDCHAPLWFLRDFMQHTFLTYQSRWILSWLVDTKSLLK